MMRFSLTLLIVVCGWFLPAASQGQAQSAPINLALNKPAQQSSTSQWSHANDAQGAVDGIKNGGYSFHTNNEPNPWWQVDLQIMSTLSEVRIYNRLELPDRARTIQVLLSNDGATWRRVYAHHGQPFGGTDGKPLVVPLNGEPARFVRLQLSETIWFHLDEVEVYGVAGVSGQAVPPGLSAAQPGRPDAFSIVAYGKDETDGSDVGWNAQYPTPSLDDDPNRRGLPNARWQGAHAWQGNQLCLSIKNLEAPYPPAHTLAVGYTVTLANGTFEDGSTTKTFVLYRFSGQPAQKEIAQCVVTNAAGAGASTAGASPAGLLETLVIPNDRPGKVTSRAVLEKDRWYLLEASGVVSDWSHVKDGVDAAWCYAEWRCGKQGEAWNQLRIDEKGLTELAGGSLPKSPDHVYRIRYQGQGKPLEAYASDAQGSASDNSGSFTLRIFQEGAAAAPAAACRGFAGDWNTQHGMVHLDVEGQTVSGSYPHKQGRIEGHVTGQVLEGRWLQSDRPGLLRFELTPDGRGFKGTWTEADGRGGGGWDGTCVSGPHPAMAAPPVSTPTATTATTTTTWATTAADHRNQNGQRFSYLCPANGTVARVWGTDVYTDDSSVCTAAVHAGQITTANGGTVMIEIRPGQPSYMGTGRYGVMTESYAAWTGSYVFVAPATR